MNAQECHLSGRHRMRNIRRCICCGPIKFDTDSLWVGTWRATPRFQHMGHEVVLLTSDVHLR